MVDKEVEFLSGALAEFRPGIEKGYGEDMEGEGEGPPSHLFI